MKNCRICNQTKPLDEFHRLAKSPDGRQPRCKECVAAYMRDYHRRNADAIKAKVKAWKNANIERTRELSRKYAVLRHEAERLERLAAKEGMERFCAFCAEQIAPEKFINAKFCSQRCQERDAHRRNKARRRQAMLGGVVVVADVITRDAGCCGICGGQVGEDFHLDHIVPICRGGPHSTDNVQLAHPRCNLKKGTLLMTELVT